MWRKLLGCLFLVAPITALAQDARTWASSICDIIDRYHEGSYHYLECLDHIKLVDSRLDLEQTIEFVCSAVDTFYPLTAADKARCYGDAQAKLKAEPLLCAPEFNVLSKKSDFPVDFPESLKVEFRSLAERWERALGEPTLLGKRGLLTELQGANKSCLDAAYGVQLESEKHLRQTLLECVFAERNSPHSAASADGVNGVLVDEFMRAYWGQYSFRKLINASLINPTEQAWPARCILEVQNPNDKTLRLFMAGYSID